MSYIVAPFAVSAGLPVESNQYCRPQLPIQNASYHDSVAVRFSKLFLGQCYREITHSPDKSDVPFPSFVEARVANPAIASVFDGVDS